MLGSPIAHSLSPALHRAGYRAAGLDWSYQACEVGDGELAGFLDGLDERWRGLSLTMPLKRSVVPLLDELSAPAQRARAVNTVVLEADRRVGHNTDIGGAATAIRERWKGPLDTAVILGGGATAASVLLALADLGCRQVSLAVRDPGRAARTLEAAGRHPGAPWVDVLPLGATPGPADILVATIPAAAQTAQVVALADRVPVIFEVSYHPWPTPLAAFAEARGRVLVSGLDLLVHQAALQFTLMTGLADAPVAAMRSAGQQALADR